MQKNDVDFKRTPAGERKRQTRTKEFKDNQRRREGFFVFLSLFVLILS